MFLHLLDLNSCERAITTDQEAHVPPVAGRLDRTQLVASSHLKQHVTCTCNHHHPLQTLDPHLPNQLIASHVNFDFSTTTSSIAFSPSAEYILCSHVAFIRSRR